MSDVARWLAIAALLSAAEIACVQAATITGVVRDPAYYAVDRADVWVVTEKCLDYRHAVTDQAGRYAFEGLAQGSYRVFATYPGLWLIGETAVQLGPDTMTSLDLQLVVSDEDTGGSPPSVPVHGVVTDAGGLPIGGARITHSGRGGQRETLSTSDGRFGFCRVSGSRIDFRVEHPGYKPRRINRKPVNGQDISLKIALRKR